MNGAAGTPHPDDTARIRDHLVDHLRRSGQAWQAMTADSGPFDLALERPGSRIAVAIRQTPFALDSATVQRLHTEARKLGHTELVVISLTSPTDLAEELALHTPGLTLIGDVADLDARLDNALRTAAARRS